MRNKTTRLFLYQLLLQPGDIAVILRGAAALFAEEGTERTQALEANAIAGVGDADAFFGQQYFGRFEAGIGQVLMRRSFIDTGKEAMEMEPRHTCLPRHLVEVDRRMVIFVDENFCPGNALVCICADLQSEVKVRICFIGQDRW